MEMAWYFGEVNLLIWIKNLKLYRKWLNLEFKNVLKLIWMFLWIDRPQNWFNFKNKNPYDIFIGKILFLMNYYFVLSW